MYLFQTEFIPQNKNKMRAELSPPVISISMKPHHLFRYPSEWDPRQNGKTKGGYLEGSIHLPRGRNLRVVLSTHPEQPHNIPDTPLSESERQIHPTLIHVVRKGRGNRRNNEKEPVPSIQHWQQEFVIRERKVSIRNKTSDRDNGRVEIPEEDEMFSINEDMVLGIGREATELNMIILIPKTEARAAGDDVSLRKLLESRISNPAALTALSEKYSKKNSVNLKKVCLKLDVFCLDSGLLLGSSISSSISDTASKAHGAMDLHDATPLRSCAKGGRKVCMIAEFAFAKDVEPRFQLYDSDGRRLFEKEESLLKQPNPDNVCVLKESIIFITPVQPHAEEIYRHKYKVKLVARRESDGYVSKKKFDFSYLPHDYYSTCYFCEFDPDNNEEQGTARLVPMKDVARPGLRKRNMSDNEGPDIKVKKKMKETPFRINLIKLPSTPLPPSPSLISHERRISQERQNVIVSNANNFVETIIKEEPTDEQEAMTSSKVSPSSLTVESLIKVPKTIHSSIPFYDLSKRTFSLPVTSASLIIPTTDIKKE